MCLIIFHITLFLVYIYFSGIGILGLISTLLRSKADIPGKIYLYPVIGYCSSLVLFRLGFPFFSNAEHTVYAVLFILSGIYLIFFMISRRRIVNKIVSFWKHFSISKENGILIVLFFVMIFYISWPYLYIGERNYYHSGNGDYFERHAVGSLFLNDVDGAINLCSFESNTITQYISQVFWTIILQTKNPMDPFIQSIVNLLMTVFGQFWLLRSVFRFSFPISIISSLCMIISNLYFTTYLAGHIGSMMYGAVAPYFLGLSICWIKAIKKNIESYQCSNSIFYSRFEAHVFFMLSALIYFFAQHTYPGPIHFLIIPLIAYAVYEWVLLPSRFWNKIQAFYSPQAGNYFSSKFQLKIVFTVLIGIIFLLSMVIFTWEYLEPKRIHNILRGSQQTWLISQTINMLMIFWGVFASDLVGSPRIVVVAHNFVSFLLFAIFFVISVFYCVVTVYGVSVINRTKKHFFLIFAFFWVCFFVMMKYFYGSPYYLYKFYYVNFFLIIPCFIVGALNILRFRNSFRWVSYLLIVFFFINNTYFNLKIAT